MYFTILGAPMLISNFFDLTHLLSGLNVCMVEDFAEHVEVVGRDDLLDEADDGGASHPIC